MMKKHSLSRKVWSVAITALMMLASQNVLAQYVNLTALSGSKINQGEGAEYLVDGKLGTKWGQGGDPASTACWVILKATTPVVPVNYFLATGNDTGTNPGRNWKDWKIYAANFGSDAEATIDADGWVLVEDRKDGGLPTANSTPVDFKFNSADGTTAYQYYYIKVTANVAQGDTYNQMDEFGLGTYSDFVEYLDAKTDDPVVYTIIAGDRNNGDGEGLKSLFDGNYGTKWGNGFNARNEGDHSNGAYFIIKTSRAMAPTYCKLVTGTDNEAWNNRNWKQWQVYGIADVPEGKTPGRWDEGWVAIDKKYNIGKDVLPDKNSYEVFLDLSESNTTKYRYFKVEIDQILSGSGYMQMSEFALGDQYTFLLDRAAMLKRAANAVDMSKPFYAELKAPYADLLSKLENTTDIFAAYDVRTKLEAQQAAANASIKAYEKYAGVIANVRNHYENHDCMNGSPAGKALIGKYLNENVAPDATFKNGSYPYIMANCLLDDAALDKETKYINSLLEAYAVDLMDGAIVGVTYTALSSNKMGGSEGAEALVDGKYGEKAHTKWGFNGSGWMVFKCNQGPIAPTYYTLVVANDTDGSEGRQWKTWKIYGGNFDNDDAAEHEADGWVLIDEKKNIGHDEFPTTNHSQTTFNMTNGGGSYKYFRIEVESNYGGGNDYTQMAEILLFNNANFMLERKDKCAEYENLFAAEDGLCYVQLKNDVQAMLQELRMSTSGAEMNLFAGQLDKLLSEVRKSEAAYEAYEETYANVKADAAIFAGLTKGTTAAWAAQYFNGAVAPSKLLRNGSHDYIMSELNLDTKTLEEETEYVYNMWRARNLDISGETTGFVYVDGHVVGQWGDGHPKHLVDNVINEPNPSYDPGVNPLSKMGGNIDTTGDTYVIFKTMEQYNPFFYTLITGSDTYSYQDRNPGSWTIYGANFDGDAEATKDAEGWVVVDQKVNIGKDRMLPQNLTASYFGFSTETAQPYQYYKIVFWGNFEGKSGAVQLQELQFGTVEQFQEIKDKYIAAANEFDANLLAYKGYTDEYENSVDGLEDCINMEVLYRTNHKLEQLRTAILASAYEYDEYLNAVEEMEELMEEHRYEESKGHDALDEYLFEYLEPCASYPNGSANYILDERNVESLAEEAALLKKLVADYCAIVPVSEAGYATVVAHADLYTEGTGVEAYAVRARENSVGLTPVAEIPAGEAVVIKAEPGTCYLPVLNGTAATIANNDLVAATEAVETDGTQYVLAQAEGEVGFYKATGTIAAGKGYLVIGDAAAKGFYPFAEDATAIQGIAAGEESGAIYNLAGQRVSKANKGIYIVNGKKVMK